MTQLGFEPFKCGVSKAGEECDGEVVCGLKNHETGLHVNVCREHFKALTGKAYRGKPRVAKAVLR